MLNPRVVIGAGTGDGRKVKRFGIGIDLPRGSPRIVDQYLAWQARRDFLNLGFDVLDRFEWVEPIANDSHTAYCFGPCFIQGTATQRGTKGNSCYVLNRNRDIVSDLDDGFFDILNLFDKAETANDVFGFVEFDGSRTDINIRHPH